MTTPEELTRERPKTHGDFGDVAATFDGAMGFFRCGPSWEKMTPVQRVALQEVVHKLARITCGDPGHREHWDDVGGYAKTVTDRMPDGAPASEDPHRVPWRYTAHEVQSRLDRLRYAEGLILQLPEDHDGRNTWLLNYGVDEVAKRKRAERGLRWDEATQAAEAAPSIPEYLRPSTQERRVPRFDGPPQGGVSPPSEDPT